MAASRYRNFLTLLEKWPVDKSRGNRDLGLFLRKRVMEGFSQGEASVINEAECEKAYISVHRIATDFHRRRWERSGSNNASGSTAESLREALSDAGIQAMKEDDEKTLKDRLLGKFLTKEES